MYEITIKNFYQNGVLNRNEQTLYHIPIQYGEKENVLTDPSVSRELGKTGTMEFTIHPNHPYYHAIAQMRTIMRVDYDGDTIFRGRVLTIDNTMSGAKRIHCEGDMAFLLDSIQMGTKKESRSSQTLNAYIVQILNNHNSQMQESGETDKCIYPGDIPGAYRATMISAVQQIPNKSDTFGSNSTEQSMNALETLTKEFGGFFRTRYSDTDKKTYLDWCRNWFRNDTGNKQPIAITQNIIDANSNSEVDNIFTALIPVGKSDGGDEIFIDGYRTDIHGNNNRILVPHIAQVFSESELANGYMTKALYEKAVDQYGIIYKVQNFSNADTQDKLWTYACDWIKNNYVGGITAYDLSAIDMHHVDKTVAKYLDGDRVELTIPSDMTELDEYNSNKLSNTVNRTLLSIKYDLHHPDKNSYTAGIPSDILNYEYGSSSTSKSKSSSGGSKGGASAKGGPKPPPGEDPEEEKERLEVLDSLAYQFVIDASHNSQEYAALNAKDPEHAAAAQKAAKMIVKKTLTDPNFKKEDITTIVLDGEKGKLSMMSPSDSQEIMSRLIGSNWANDPRYAALLDRNEAYVNATNSLIIDAGDKAIAFRGNTAPTKDQMTEKLKEYNLTGNETPEEIAAIMEDITESFNGPETVVEITTVVDNQGNESGKVGLSKEDNENVSLNAGGSGGEGSIDVGKSSANSSFKVNLNRAVTYTDKNGSRVTKTGFVSADDFQIKDHYDSLSARLLVVNDLIADRATIGQLDVERARISTLESNSITTSNLAAKISSLGLVQFGGAGGASINGGNISCSRLSTTTLQVNGNTYSWKTLGGIMLSNGNTASIQYLGA